MTSCCLACITKVQRAVSCTRHSNGPSLDSVRLKRDSPESTMRTDRDGQTSTFDHEFGPLALKVLCVGAHVLGQKSIEGHLTLVYARCLVVIVDFWACMEKSMCLVLVLVLAIPSDPVLILHDAPAISQGAQHRHIGTGCNRWASSRKRIVA